MKAIVHVKRRVIGRGMDGIIDGKFGQREEITPMCERGCKTAEDIFDDTITALSLTISLWMSCSRH